MATAHVDVLIRDSATTPALAQPNRVVGTVSIPLVTPDTAAPGQFPSTALFPNTTLFPGN